MAEKQFGGWYDNPDAGGQNMRWWGNYGWTTGSDPTQGGGTSTPTVSTSSSPAPRTATGIDESQLPSTLDYVTKLNATEDTAFNDLIMAMKARKSPLDVYTGLEEASGLPAMRTGAISLSKAIANLEDTLETVEPDVAARSRESLLTEAQRRGIVTQRQEPILKNLAKTTTGLGRLKELISLTGQDVGTKANLFLQGQEQELEPLKMKYTALVDRNARLLSAFTSDKQTKLEILMDKLNRERELSDQEWQLANTLTASATEYHRQLEKAAADAGARVTGNETDDQLLSMIGSQAAAAIKRSGSGSATTAAKKAAIQRLAQESAGTTGLSLTDAMTKYAGQLSPEEIVQTYQGSTGRGTVVEPWAQKILGIDSSSGVDQNVYNQYINAGYSPAAALMMAKK